MSTRVHRATGTGAAGGGSRKRSPSTLAAGLCPGGEVFVPQQIAISTFFIQSMIMRLREQWELTISGPVLGAHRLAV